MTKEKQIPEAKIQEVPVEKPLDQVLTETELGELFGLNVNQISGLRRQKHLPFIQVTQRRRLYFVSDILYWCQRNRQVLNVADIDDADIDDTDST